MPSRVIRFGIFTLEPGNGALLKRGTPVKLQDQSFQMLSILLERPNQVVTREELRAHLWPDTYVDFDLALNTAVRKIRRALGDSAENPRFIETVPKRGYRFIAPVEEVQAEDRPMPPDPAPSSLEAMAWHIEGRRCSWIGEFISESVQRERRVVRASG